MRDIYVSFPRVQYSGNKLENAALVYTKAPENYYKGSSNALLVVLFLPAD